MGSLNALMRNTHYIGYYDFKDGKSEEEIRVECPRILSSDLWSRVKATRDKYMERRRSENPTKHFYLLKHILRCAHCGTWLSGIYSAKQTKNHYYCPKKERVWSKRPIAPEDKWKRGRVCEMTRSLNIEATDELVWNAVLDALGKSSLMKETIRKEFTGAGGQKLQASAKEAKAREGKIKQLQKLIAKLDDSLVELETDRLLGKVTSAQYPKIKAKITEEKVNAEAEVEQIQQLIHGAEQQKNWIDWVGKFQKKIDTYRTFTPEQKKELLQGLLTTIDVHLIDKQTHWLEINFKIPLVGDQLVYKDPTKKTKGYTVREGETALMVEMVSRPYSKKKQ